MELIFAASFLLAFGLYFLPSIIAGKRNHPNQWAIFFVNLALGWTVIGWLGAVLWAISGTGQPSTAQPRGAHPQQG